jgi:UDP-N-acetyl-D-mannosaminuronic acid dehydrogenase
MSEITNNKVCVIGLGYIGLPTSALLACNNYIVHGVDIDENAVNTINRGEIHIVEPGLADFVSRAVEDKTLVASTTPDFADVFIIAVPTPFYPSKDTTVPTPDISYVIDATKAIAPYIKPGNTIILESTSPVGTTDKIKIVLEDLNIDTTKIYIAHCPERVLPGQIMKELVENDRIVGGLSDECTQVAANFYKTFVTGAVLTTDAKTAEMSKLTENASRDVSIAFANELSLLCDKMDIDVWELISLANRHPRVNILQPGCGVGGHCIAVDPWFIVSQFPNEARLIKTAREINDSKPLYVIMKVKEAIKGLNKPKIACLGLAFKPDIDDLRESPALAITKMLSDTDGYEIMAVEPNVKVLPDVLGNRKNVSLVSLDTAITTADIIVILVKHKEFIGLKSDKLLDFVNI